MERCVFFSSNIYLLLSQAAQFCPRLHQRALARLFNSLLCQPPTAPSRYSNDILDKFIAVNGADEKKNAEDKRVLALLEAANALTEIGMDLGEKTVKKFLNRIAGLDVSRQNLVFSLFMSTLDDVITDAKATGEFEGSVEDIRASNVTMKNNPEVIAVDTSCGASTELTRLILDRGVSFDKMVQTIIQETPAKETSEADNAMAEEESDDDNDEGLCKSGFYISRRKIAGRHLVMFAQRKNEKEDSGSSDFIDLARNLMIITRPNTGKNPCEMANDELRYKYKLLVSVADIMKHLLSEGASDILSDEEKKSETDTSLQVDDAIGLIRQKWGPSVAYLWDDAYENSNHKDHHDGLAPRISEMGLITGAVLHILPTLEKAVQFMSQSSKALRVMRAELSDSGERIVGIKFPMTNVAMERLRTGMKALAEARQGSLNAPSFKDEKCSPVDEKARNWAMAERKTMKSFFGAKTPANKSDGRTTSSSDAGKRKMIGSYVTPSLSAKKPKSGPKGKTASLASFFGKKNG